MSRHQAGGREARGPRLLGLAAAILLLAGCVRTMDRGTWELWSRGNDLSEERRWEEAAGVLGQAAARSPDVPALQRSLALALQNAGRDAEALAAYQAAARLQPDVAEVHANLAALLARDGRRAEALAELEVALRLAPEDAELWLRRALVLRDLDRRGEAVAAVDRALALAPDSAQAHAQRGLLLHRQGRRVEASQEFRRALALDPRAHVRAAAVGESDVVERLVAEGADVSATDEAGLTALMAAAATGQRATAEHLIGLGADPNAQGPRGWRPLMYAAWQGRTDTVRLLAARGAAVGARTTSGSTALMIAAFWGHAGTVHALLALGADPRAADARGRTAIRLAGAVGYQDVVDVLRAAGIEDVIDLSSGEALAFGRLLVLTNGDPQVPYHLERPTVRLFHVETGAIRDLDVDEAGGFAWHLPRGTYVIERLRYRGYHAPRLVFQVPYGAEALYVGTLTIDVVPPHLLALALTASRRTTVADESATAARILADHAVADATVAPSLAVHDPGLPLDLDTGHAALSRRLEQLGIRLVRTPP